MREELNSLRPYSYKLNSKSRFVTYRFVTDFETTYEVYFSDASGYFEKYSDFCNHIVMIGFRIEEKTVISQINRKLDFRIRDTIFKIILDSANSNSNRSFMIVCDQHDGRQAFRNELFKRWYVQFNEFYPDKFSKENLSINSDGLPYTFLSMLIPVGIQYQNEVKEAFLNLNDDLISKGY